MVSVGGCARRTDGRSSKDAAKKGEKSCPFRAVDDLKCTMTKILSFMIVCYQRTKHAFFPAACRFYPSCSEYSLQALSKYGAVKGIWLSLKRIARCSPLSLGGYDPLK